MEKRYGLDAICYLHDVASGAGSSIQGPSAIPVEQRISELKTSISRARRELACLEQQLLRLEGPPSRQGIFRRMFGRTVEQQG